MPDLMRKIHLNAGVITQEICMGLHICYAALVYQIYSFYLYMETEDNTEKWIFMDSFHEY